MSLTICGRCWKFGDNVNTDMVFPQRHSHITDPNEIAKHAMEGYDPEFSKKVGQGDIIVAGKNFGCGSSMEHAPIALKSVGIAAIIAESFARIFYRNAISLGLPVIESQDIFEEVTQGDILEISLIDGRVENLTTHSIYRIKPIPKFLIDILKNGGLVPHLINKFSLCH